jgi:UDP-N-acetylglucosamine 4,6-dehydratase
MTRFWIHIDTVTGAVIEALRIMGSGEIFVPKMHAAKVKDLMKAVAPECKLKVVGVRPGEKLHETLITEHEALRTRDAGKLFVIEPEFIEWSRSAMKKYPRIKAGAIYSSDNPKYLLPAKKILKELKL